jgi:DNA polymerase-3 subunit gamma/tau
MSYEVIARRWRPRCFEDVVGQPGVTQTLRNAISSDRIAQAFVFAGPRGVGKTTTARILARALNCEKGPTPDPCGACAVCEEIANGRDIDVLELDAATHTGIDTVREVIIDGLAIMPVRDRYKIFVIDEFHQLSSSSFNALLKSLEEPPPHVVFMMATTELKKIPKTVLSRSQVFEFLAIGTRVISEQLRKIASKEKIQIDEAAIAILAREAEGSMRDAQSSFDQVIAFANEKITTEEVSAVLGLVGRDLLFDVFTAVADERASTLIELAGSFVESGCNLRLVCRDLSRLCRDLLVLGIDSKRIDDSEIAPEHERDRLQTLQAQFSREDLMRGFEVLARAEDEIRKAVQPRYHFEMALLRWVHLRKLVPLTELMKDLQAGRPASSPVNDVSHPSQAGPSLPSISTKKPSIRPASSSSKRVPTKSTAKHDEVVAPRDTASVEGGGESTDIKNALLTAIKSAKKFFYGTVVAQAKQIEVSGDRVTFVFSPTHRTLQEEFERQRSWLESRATEIMSRKIVVVAKQAEVDPDESAGGAEVDSPLQDQAAQGSETMDTRLKKEAMAEAAVQEMLAVLPAKIRDVKKSEV